MDKRLRVILCILFIAVIGVVTVWRSLGSSDKDEISNKNEISNIEEMEEATGKAGTSQEETRGSDAEACEDCQNCVMQIRCEYGGGNAVLLCKKEDSYVLCTAAHVVNGLEKQNADQWHIELDGEQVNAKAIWVSDTYDVAFLEIAKQDIFTDKQAAGLSEEGYTNLKEGDTLFIWSRYNGELTSLEIEVNQPWILIEDFGYHMIWASATDAKGGMSGSGAFDCEGYLAGILCGGNQTEVAILPVNIILGELKNSSIDISFD